MFNSTNRLKKTITVSWFSYQKDWFPNLSKQSEEIMFPPNQLQDEIQPWCVLRNACKRFMYSLGGGVGGGLHHFLLFVSLRRLHRRLHVFPPLALVACFPTPDSCPLRRLHIFPPLALLTCFGTFVTVSRLPAVITSHLILLQHWYRCTCMDVVFSSLTFVIVIAKHSMFYSY